MKKTTSTVLRFEMELSNLIKIRGVMTKLFLKI